MRKATKRAYSITPNIRFSSMGQALFLHNIISRPQNLSMERNANLYLLRRNNIYIFLHEPERGLNVLSPVVVLETAYYASIPHCLM
jgi:hypothetical protein